MKRDYYVSKYQDRMDEIHRELSNTDVEDIDYACTMEFDQTANAEEVVGYYLINCEWNPLEAWLENIEGIDLTEQDKEVTRMLKELKRNDMSFINDQEKMVDFFTVDKVDFLNFYSYLTDEEYEATKQDVLSRSGYWNAEALAEDRDINGITIGLIVQSIMMTEWLQSKR